MLLRVAAPPVLLAVLLALAGCATTATEAPLPAPGKPPRPAAARPGDTVSGVALVLGRTIDEVTEKLGTPSFERREGGAHHLQFGGPPCVLDVYFYEDPPGTPATARHAEARFVDGRDAEAGACVDARRRARIGY